MNREQLMKQIGELTVKNHELTQRYTGFLNLHSAACLANHQAEMEQYRQSILSVVEQILDNNAVQYLLTRQLIALGGPPTQY